MKISKRGEYALRALIDLGIASELGWPMLQVSELATKEKLPIKFLEQIFTQLKTAGYVESRRGKFGGYSLARPMKRIKFGEVIRMIDGPLAPIRCVSQTSYARCSCPDENHCGLRILMFDVRNAIRYRSSIAIPLPTSSRSPFANIGATRSRRLFFIERSRWHQCYPRRLSRQSVARRKWRH